MSLNGGGTTPPPLETTPLTTKAAGGVDKTGSGAVLQQNATIDLDETTPVDTTPASSNPRPSLWQTVRNSGVVSLRLENSGSVARDHLASERTFLAYIRTSLAIASSGVALVQLFTVSDPSYRLTNSNGQAFVRPLGATAIIIGINVLLIGVTRYFIVQSALTKGHFPAARMAMGFIAFSLFTLVVTTFAFLVTDKVGSGNL